MISDREQWAQKIMMIDISTSDGGFLDLLSAK
jgi:hypothetical protein